MSIIAAEDQPRLEAIDRVYASLTPEERFVLRESIQALSSRHNEAGIFGVGHVIAREVLAAVGMKMAEKEQSG